MDAWRMVDQTTQTPPFGAVVKGQDVDRGCVGSVTLGVVMAGLKGPISVGRSGRARSVKLAKDEYEEM
jgi:hypothetical protein